MYIRQLGMISFEESLEFVPRIDYYLFQTAGIHINENFLKIRIIAAGIREYLLNRIIHDFKNHE